MALSDRKFLLWAVLSVAFIPLSVLSNPVQQLEGHRCYWCGPLAEQVHRSQRAANCNGDKSKVTICDEDLPYCAIVASSPPYVESRYCVKFYQDECYPLYCNSTKIWKVICPCRGELCNGPNTKRENEVFEELHKLTQTKRLKRALITNGAFIGITTHRNKIDNITIKQNVDVLNDEIKNKENDNAANSIIESHDSHKPGTDKISKMQDTGVSSEVPEAEVTTHLNTETSTVEMSPTDNTDTVKVEAPVEHYENIAPNMPTSNEYSATIAVETITIEIEIEETTSVDSNIAQTTESNAVETTSTESHTGNDNYVTEEPVVKNTNRANDIYTVNGTSTNGKQNEPSIKIDIPISSIASDDLKTDIIVMSSNAPTQETFTMPSSVIETKVYVNPSLQRNTPGTKSTASEVSLVSIETVTEMAVTTQIEIKLGNTRSKGNEELPAAEALQHNDTPSTKTMETMHTTSTTVTKINTIDHNTPPTMLRNNTAVRIDAHILTIVIGIILQY